MLGRLKALCAEVVGVTVVKREDDGTCYSAFPGKLKLPEVEGHVVEYDEVGLLWEYLGLVWRDRTAWEERRRREKVVERAERVKARARGKEEGRISELEANASELRERLQWLEENSARVDGICEKLRGLKATGEAWPDLDAFLAAQGGDAALIKNADWETEIVDLEGGGAVDWTKTCMRNVTLLYAELAKKEDKLAKTRLASGKALAAAETRVASMLRESQVKVRGVRRWYDKFVWFLTSSLKVVVRVPARDVLRVKDAFSWAFWCPDGGDVLFVRDGELLEDDITEVGHFASTLGPAWENKVRQAWRYGRVDECEVLPQGGLAGGREGGRPGGLGVGFGVVFWCDEGREVGNSKVEVSV